MKAEKFTEGRIAANSIRTKWRSEKKGLFARKTASTGNPAPKVIFRPAQPSLERIRDLEAA